jgi:hypothetical protein
VEKETGKYSKLIRQGSKEFFLKTGTLSGQFGMVEIF